MDKSTGSTVSYFRKKGQTFFFILGKYEKSEHIISAKGDTTAAEAALCEWV